MEALHAQAWSGGLKIAFPPQVLLGSLGMSCVPLATAGAPPNVICQQNTQRRAAGLTRPVHMDKSAGVMLADLW